MGRRVPGGRVGNPASASIWNRGPESTKIAMPLEGHKLTKVSATICRVDGTARWLMMAERISCAWLGLPGSSPADQSAGPLFLRAWSEIVCSTEHSAVTSAMSMVASSSLRGKFFSFRPLRRPDYLCFLAGAGFFAGWDFFAGSDFFCTLTGAFTAVFLLGTLCFAAGFATAPRTILAGTDFDGTGLAVAALAGTGFMGSAFFPAAE